MGAPAVAIGVVAVAIVTPAVGIGAMAVATGPALVAIGAVETAIDAPEIGIGALEVAMGAELIGTCVAGGGSAWNIHAGGLVNVVVPAGAVCPVATLREDRSRVPTGGSATTTFVRKNVPLGGIGRLTHPLTAIVDGSAGPACDVTACAARIDAAQLHDNPVAATILNGSP